MSFIRLLSFKTLALTSCAAITAIPAAAYAQAEQKVSFSIKAQDLGKALTEFGMQSGKEVYFVENGVAGKMSTAVNGSYTPTDAIKRLLANSGVTYQVDRNGTILVGKTQKNGSRNSAAPASGAQNSQNSDNQPIIIVTAQKREEAIQNVPIAVSAFSSDDLEAFRIEGGSELLRAVPNVTFSKSNFSMYNFSIRGVGTKAISAASDPAVAISFNNTPLIRNRLFEQEYLDVERVEVLRGPQGTLYGRNATGGVVNMIPRLPTYDFEGEIEVEAGNFDTRRMRGMINIPISDTFAIRGAGAMTKRDGFDFNTFKQTKVNDRDLWSTRLSAQWEPSDRFRANIIWEHFEEDDNRSRTGKQLCTRDPGPGMVGNTEVTVPALQNYLSQGCLPETLFDDAAFGVPNAASFPAARATSVVISLGGVDENGNPVSVVGFGVDPYEGLSQSRDLREIATSYDPLFRAKNNIVQLNLEFDLTDQLTLFSQTAYAKDDYWSTQDYARYISNPIFPDTSKLFSASGDPRPSPLSPGGVFTDPQLGPSSRLESADLSQSDNEQWYQELRLQSDFDGSFNFSLGANYLDFKSQDDYYVFNNLFTVAAQYIYSQESIVDRPPNTGLRTEVCDENYRNLPAAECVYTDPTPISDLAGDGHNYFRSKNVINTESWALFGEGYLDIQPDLRLTAGLRYTRDVKTSTPFPTQLLLGAGLNGETGESSGGSLRRGFFADPDVKQKWGALTGRLVLDWMPELDFTNDTLIYGSFSRGYKGGGTNPPRAAINPDIVQYLPIGGTFEPEYVNAFEIGTKNTLLNGAMTLNLTGFYYDYKDYQVSQIVDRTSLNENYDAEIWGLELETAWQATDNLRLNANVGYLKTRIDNGESSIDVMNRTQGNPDWTLIRPWVQVPSNCVAPTEYAETVINGIDIYGDFITTLALSALCSGSRNWGTFNPEVQSNLRFYQFYGFTYDPLTEAPNSGRGFAADLGSNELPNAPRWTVNFGAQYTVPIDDWELTLRGDYYWQDKSFFRVYNTEYDRLKSWDNTNLAVTLARPADGLVFQAYVKNVFDNTPITDAFTNSDDTQLTTNVFTLDPRLFGFSISKSF